jgi:hypothetical protein
MLLYSRTLALRGPQAETMAWAAEVTAHVNSTTKLDVGCWMGLYGVPIGSLAWVAAVDGHAEIAEEGAKLAGDAAFASLVNRAAEWVVAPPQDSLRAVVSGGRGEGGPPAVGSVAAVTTANVALGKVAEAMAWSVEMADYVTRLTGNTVSLYRDLYGPFGSISWIGIASDMAAVDKETELISNDEGYLTRIAGAGDLFVPTSGNAGLMVRIA